MVAAEHEREEAAAPGVLDEPRDACAGAEDRLEVPRPRIADIRRLGQARADVAPVDDRAAEALDPLLQAGVPDRGRPHVDPAPPGAEVEPRADDGDGPRLSVRVHRGAG